MTNKRKEPRWDEAEQKFILLLAGVIIGVAIIVVASRIELVAWVLAALIGIIVVGIIGYILLAATNILWLMYKSNHQDDNLKTGDDAQTLTVMNRDERIESMLEHYLSIIDSGLDLYDFKPELPTGDMATNRYAQEDYTIKIVAFGRAIVTIPTREPIKESENDQ